MRGVQQPAEGNCVVSCAIKPEKRLCGFARCFSNFLQRNASCRRDHLRYDARIRGFAALSTKGRGRQVWGVGFDHEFPERNFCRDVSHGYAVFKSNNSRERNEVLEIENFIGLIARAAEAMKDAA